MILPTESTLDPRIYPMAKHIEHWTLDRLVPNPRNARTHSDAQVAQIAGSIRQFGFNERGVRAGGSRR